MKLTDKKVFITGADGFIGSHLAELLIKNCAKVKCLVYYNSWNSLGWLSDIEPALLKNAEIIFGDVRDSGFVEKNTKGADVIFHLASLISIPYSYSAPESYVDTNIGGAMNILNSALKNGVEKVLHTSTSEVYGSALYTPIDEKHPLQPQSPYSASKIAADMLALSYWNTFKLPVTIVRPFNTFGARQTPRAIIPTIITQVLKNRSEKKPIKIGSLFPKRDFNFVKDVALGFFNIAQAENVLGETLNIASTKEISIGDLATLIMKIVQTDLDIISDEQRVRPDSSEVDRLLGDASKLKRLCGWEPQFTLEEGMKIVIEWISKKLADIDSERYWF